MNPIKPLRGENGLPCNRRNCLGLIVLFMNLTCWRCINTFNVDTAFPIQFDGPPRSYFGYSVALLHNSKGNWVIVGAPRANSSYFPTLMEPGEVSRCSLSTRTCSSVQFDKEAISEEYIDAGRQYKDKKDNMWLGVSVDTTSEKQGRMVACAHLWKNVFYERYRLVNGACYTLDGEFDQDTMEKHIPLIAKSDQFSSAYESDDDYKFAFAQQGISAHFMKNSDQLLLGATGIMDWKGSTVHLSSNDLGLKRRKSGNTYTNAVVTRPISELEETAYFGYAVTSGHFLRNRPAMLAIGAPRQNYKGKIYIVEIKNGRYDQKVDKTGEQMGEYFGAALCAVDLNNDGLDDLLVGAPMYSKYSDEGRVYIFINKGNVLFQLSQEFLMGSQKVGARFGSSMAAIGDVNMDGYSDVAIGAPFEDGHGAVYIYHGSANGLKSRYQQKILASQGSSTAKGFGVSISRGMDLDGNNYPDLAIGAYSSSEMFVFRTRPVVYLSGTVIPSLSQLNMDVKDCKLDGQDVSCFTLEVCMSYHGKFVTQKLDINFSIKIDSLKESESNGARAFLKANNKMTQQLQEKVTLSLQTPNCQQHSVYAVNAPKDYMTPIEVVLAYQLAPEVNPLPDFCASCPLLDGEEPNQKTAQVRFMKHCGSDEMCDTDLKLTAAIQDFGPEDVFEIGSRDSIVLRSEIVNSAEPAYATILTLDIPSWMTIDQKPVVCEFINDDPHQLQCMVANPLMTDEKVTYEFQLNLEKIPANNGSISIQLTVQSDSTEETLNLKDNNVSLEIQTKAVADVFIVGSTPNEQAFYEEADQGKILENATTLFSHTYEVSNSGPSPIQQIIVKVKYPSNSLDGQKMLMQLVAIDTIDGQRGATFGSCDGKIAEQFSSSAVHGPGLGSMAPQLENRKRREVTDSSSAVIKTNAFILNCSTAICETVSCIVGPFDKDASATLVLSFVVDVFNLSNMMYKKDMVTIVTEGQVIIPDGQAIVQPDDHKPDYMKVSTDVKSGGSPPPKQLATWIIPVSICGGILLFVLLTAALMKLGFFRRRKKEEMERLLAQDDKGQGQSQDMEMDG